MEYDYYKLYLAIDYEFKEDNKIICQSLDQVEYELNKANGFNEYLLVGHINEKREDDIIAQGYIEVNRKRKTR